MESCVCTSQRRGKNIPLTLTEIADAQRKDQELKVYFKKNAKMPQKDIGLHLIEDTKVLRKNGKIIIRTSLRHRAVSWYHHYLQLPGQFMNGFQSRKLQDASTIGSILKDCFTSARVIPPPAVDEAIKNLLMGTLDL